MLTSLPLTIDNYTVARGDLPVSKRCLVWTTLMAEIYNCLRRLVGYYLYPATSFDIYTSRTRVDTFRLDSHWVVMTTSRSLLLYTWCAVAAWRNGNGVGRINEVTIRRARLVLGYG